MSNEVQTPQEWQSTFGFSRVIRFAKATPETAPPPRPQLGHFMDWDTANEWTVAPFTLSPDDFEISEVEDDSVPAKGAGQPKKVGTFRDSVPMDWDSITVPSDEVGKKLFNFATNIIYDEEKNSYRYKAQADRASLILEAQGRAFIYLASVEIYAPLPTQMGKKRLFRQPLFIPIFGTADSPTGVEWFEFTEAVS